MNGEIERPWNWCDRRCERCPLAIDCALNRRVEEKKEAARERGLDPDDPSVSMQMVMESFEEAIDILTRELERTEIEAEDLESISLEPTREGIDLYEAGLRYLQAIDEVTQNVDANEIGLANEARLVGMILVGKTARLLHDLPMKRESIMREHTALTLLLISVLEHQAAAMVMALGADRMRGLFRFRRAREDLRRMLDAHVAGIERREREVVERMVAAGRAPSPFCIALGPPLRAA